MTFSGKISKPCKARLKSTKTESVYLKSKSQHQKFSKLRSIAKIEISRNFGWGHYPYHKICSSFQKGVFKNNGEAKLRFFHCERKYNVKQCAYVCGTWWAWYWGTYCIEFHIERITFTNFKDFKEFELKLVDRFLTDFKPSFS